MSSSVPQVSLKSRLSVFLHNASMGLLIRLITRTARLSIQSSHLPPRHYSYSTNISHDPLRILFCGSDEFSIASLRALHAEQEKDHKLIASLDVVCRPGKRVGRGLKKIKDGTDTICPTARFLADAYISTHCRGCKGIIVAFAPD